MNNTYHVTSAIKITSSSVKKNSGKWLISFRYENNDIHLELTDTVLRTLGRQCISAMPDIVAEANVSAIEDSFRLQGEVIKSIDNRSMQHLLRKLSVQTLIDFSWYMNDRDLLTHIANNLSQRAGEHFLMALEQRWRGKDPSKATESEFSFGRVALVTVIKSWERLVEAGEVKDILY